MVQNARTVPSCPAASGASTKMDGLERFGTLGVVLGSDGIRRRRARAIAICWIAWACNNENPPVDGAASDGSGLHGEPSATQLPSARLEGDMSVEEALNLRKSVRDYSDQALTETEIAQLLWAAQGYHWS